MNFSTIFSWHASRNPEKVAIWFEERKITYGDLNRNSSCFARYLKVAKGYPGDMVAILLHNQPEYFFAAIGANRAGLAFLPLNYRLAEDELKYILLDSGAKFLVTESSFKSTIENIR